MQAAPLAAQQVPAAPQLRPEQHVALVVHFCPAAKQQALPLQLAPLQHSELALQAPGGSTQAMHFPLSQRPEQQSLA